MFLLQGARLEDLTETVLAWLARNPPGPLDEDSIVVPSNGVGEWFKASTARSWGVCAGMRVELPARFLWRIQRCVLDDELEPPGGSRFDKHALSWWLYGLMSPQPGGSAGEGAPAGSLPGWHPRSAASTGHPLPGPGDPPLDAFRWCSRVADLFDQYQVYRSDWLEDWRVGRLQIRPEPSSPAVPVPEAYRWQAQLWSHLCNLAGDPASQGSRPERHRHLIGRLSGELPPRIRERLPGRVVALVCAHLPPQTLELLAALSRHRPVLLAVLNPCLVQWADLADAPGQGQPLLAAWGGQARDVLRQIERFDDRLALIEGRRMGRAERDEAVEPACALERLQVAIRLNESTAQTQAASAGPLNDGSLRFHRAHSTLREVEALHDHLLHLLDTTDLQPQQIVVMVPALERFAPAIRAVFGAVDAKDERFIPWGMADHQTTAEDGLVAVIDWLLSLPSQRAKLEDWHRLAACSSFRRRWALEPEDLPRLAGWLDSAGVRWGIDERHRAGVGLEVMGSTNTWSFGARRMLLGYALGAVPGDLKGVAPLETVQGLEGHAAGVFAAVCRRLSRWLELVQQPAEAPVWAARLRRLTADLFDAADDADAPTWAAFERCLATWQGHAQAAQSVRLPWTVMHESLMQTFVAPGDPSARFQAPGVTFCTLMPLRAVPFEVVCLLGMNEGEYPRPVVRSSDDLMALPGMARPGDRSRRSDDRQLMLDALLSARRHLLVSWVGRSAQDQQEQPASVLVGHLRDVLASIWSPLALEAITVEHPLQPFSPRYFQEDPTLPGTYAREWEPRVAAQAQQPEVAAVHVSAQPALVPADSPGGAPEDEKALERWLVHPVAEWTRARLGLQWPRDSRLSEEDEPMSLDGLQGWALRCRALEMRRTDGRGDAQALMARAAAEGRLPLGAPGLRVSEDLTQELSEWLEAMTQARGHRSCRVEVLPSRVRRSGGASTSGAWRDEHLVPLWWRQCMAASTGQQGDLLIVAPDGVWWAPAPDPTEALEITTRLRQDWRLHQTQPHPWPADSRAIDAALSTTASTQSRALNELAQRDPAWRRHFGSARDWAAVPPEGQLGFGHDLLSWQQATQRLYGDYRAWRVEVLKAGFPDGPAVDAGTRHETHDRLLDSVRRGQDT